MANTRTMSLRIPDALRTRIEQAAKDDGRTVSNWLCWVAQQALEGKK
jgi:predicted DNA-binding protein